MDEVAGAMAPDGSARGHTANQDVELPLPRTIISRDRPSVESLLQVLDLGGPAAAAAWRFLMRLPTNPEMLEGVRSLQGFRSSGNGVDGEGETLRDGDGVGERWKTLLGPPGSHRMLYTLQIVDGVLDMVTTGGGGVGGGLPEGGKGTIVVEDEERLREREVRERVPRHFVLANRMVANTEFSGTYLSTLPTSTCTNINSLTCRACSQRGGKLLS